MSSVSVSVSHGSFDSAAELHCSVSLYSLAIRERSGKYPVQDMCRILEVSEPGYYRWRKTKDRPKREQLLWVTMDEIRELYPDNDNYGARRMHLVLKMAGEIVSYSTMYRTIRTMDSYKSANGTL
jgi:hypothetical protein